jgi:transposase, IS30 family
MKKYTRISLEEREKIYLLQKQDIDITAIAKALGRHKSNISRELKKCKDDPLGYTPDRAHAMYRAGLSRNKALFLDPNLQDYVISKLTICRWTPKEISASLKLSGLGLKASGELIYQFIYSKVGLKYNLPSYLKFRRKKRGMRKSRKRKKPNIMNFISVHDRSQDINERKEVGHWEGDLIIFTTLRSKNITTLVERKTRFTKLVLNSSKTSEEVIGGIKEAFDGEPFSLKSITFDRGTEFANHHQLPTNTYFCDPGSPWQKGAVENMNGRIRNLLPKHVRPYFLKQKDLDIIADILNNTPRQVLGFKTPQELFHAHLSEAPS